MKTNRQSLVNEFGEPKGNSFFSLAWIAFCRLIIETSSAAFNHVSMSFHDKVVTIGNWRKKRFIDGKICVEIFP
jgi:hypothetical protein